ncbi:MULTISPECIES: DUF502 domain-containing protein [unclassified Ectothiorhodospira]|uniref:DUF502 domain-containing protein n=1 Tax=unclassified Ectothiorhodospira TaxID=2684909 RepID=UPI001EE7EFEB|nr:MULTISPECIES: DUF502 domain-containing protein [unclassified Ectothiorhodospira]MCG5514974.1 DUF502 domain-containing protein [Ectothiorhodospira sp. 9100]MCG5517702.1 DUF502 domain-containing protein [Ectothiorhodospira sp. 9905]
MKGLTRTFLAGLAAILPIVVTVTLVLWLSNTLEQVLGAILKAVLPDVLYFPGMGLLIGILLIFALGVLLRVYLVQGVFHWLESWMERIPVVKTIHGVVRDVTQLFSGEIHERFGEAVLVTLPGLEFRLVGFVTRSDFEGLPDNLGTQSTVAVYLPMSYQIGGYTLMLPRDRVEPLNLSLEDAMRYTLTAGVSARRED